MTSTFKQLKKNDINIIAVVHDDVPELTRKTIYADYFEPLVRELESFTERKVNVVFAGGEPQSNFEYKGDDIDETARRWAPLGESLLEDMINEGLAINNLTLVILLTKELLKGTLTDLFDEQVLGSSLWDSSGQPGAFALASLLTYRSVGYQVGLFLGAKPEDAETQFNGWFAETYMMQARDPVKSNSYTFSAANRKNITNFLANKD
jgi:hypothetical protein